MHAYVWDRYYGICLAKYQHTDVVNSVAFNPRDSEMLVTTSDDYTIKVNEMTCNLIFYFLQINLNFFINFYFEIKIWRSIDRCRELNAAEIKRAAEFRK